MNSLALINDIIKCPRGKILTKRTQTDRGSSYRSNIKDCKNCPLRADCLGKKASREIVLKDSYELMLRARRRSRLPDKEFKEVYKRHRHMIEGMHGEAKTQHGLRRAARRGLENVSIQAFLTAAVINLKRLVTHGANFNHYIHIIIDYIRYIMFLGGARRNLNTFNSL